MDANTEKELTRFLDQWSDDSNGCKQLFMKLKSHASGHGDVKLEFVPRPGLTYSLRTARTGQTQRPLFALIDVIDESPRWLSVCFYEDMITDPEEHGDLVPEGLMGEDGYCLDAESNDPALTDYLIKRLDEAYENASG